MQTNPRDLRSVPVLTGQTGAGPLPPVPAKSKNQVARKNPGGPLSHLPPGIADLPAEMLLALAQHLRAPDLCRMRLVNKRFRSIADTVLPPKKQDWLANSHLQSLAAITGHSVPGEVQLQTISKANDFLSSLPPDHPQAAALARQLLAAAQWMPLDRMLMESICINGLRSAEKLPPNERHAIVKPVFDQARGRFYERPGALDNDVNVKALAALYSLRNTSVSPEMPDPEKADIPRICRMFAEQLITPGFRLTTGGVCLAVPVSSGSVLRIFNSLCRIFPHGTDDAEAAEHLQFLEGLIRSMPQIARPSARKTLALAAGQGPAP